MLEGPVAPVKKQPKISLTACIGSATVVPSLLKTFTTSKTLFAKKGGAFKEAGFQVMKMAKETSRMLEEEGDRGKEDAILLAKVSDLDEGIAIVVQVCSDGVELITKTTDAVDDIILEAFEVMDCSVARLLRDFFVLYRHRPMYRTTKKIFTGVSEDVINYNSLLTNATRFVFGRQEMTMKSYRDKLKMKIDQGAFENALEDEGAPGTILQPGLGNDGPEKVHAPATLWMTTKAKARDVALVYGPRLKQSFTAYSSSFATKLMACRTQTTRTLTRDVSSV